MVRSSTLVLPIPNNPYLHLAISNVLAGVQPATLAALNPLRASTGPRTSTTRGKAATPVPLSSLPPVTLADFREYLDQVQEQWDRWQKTRALGSSGLADMGADGDEARQRRLASALTSSTTITKASLPSLESVPSIFFDEAFDLANPRTFGLVTATLDSQSIADLATDQILPEKLSRNLDVVELHLTLEISQRSPRLFRRPGQFAGFASSINSSSRSFTSPEG